MELSKVIPLVVGSLTIVGGLIGGATWIDSRYAHHTELVRLAQDGEQQRLETTLQLYSLRLNQLRSKVDKTADDVAEITYLEAASAKIRERLAGITKGEG